MIESIIIVLIIAFNLALGMIIGASVGKSINEPIKPKDMNDLELALLLLDCADELKRRQDKKE